MPLVAAEEPSRMAFLNRLFLCVSKVVVMISLLVGRLSSIKIRKIMLKKLWLLCFVPPFPFFFEIKM